MLSKQEIIDKATQLQFDDIGFATAEPFDEHKRFLTKIPDNFTWASVFGLPLEEGCNPQSILPQAKTIIVLIENYFKFSFPKSMEPYFGRCYMDDDRVTKDGLTVRIRQFVSFLREHGLQAKVTFSIPQKAAAARAGIGNFGKNCLLYAKSAACGSSWISPVTIIVDREFEADEPATGIGCPQWCRNACVAACPTRALKGNCTIDSKQCISFLTYFGQGITPRELREPMGTYIYGCDRCQEVCPRNRAWMAQVLPLNPRVAAKEQYFDIVKLLYMDEDYYQHFIQPHMFYMPVGDLWRWKMNVARAMGNSLNMDYVPQLIKAFEENTDERVRGMIAWALSKLGGVEAKHALLKWRNSATAAVKEEIEMALQFF
ncbi:MAG: 4Fe-4S double cluster binding domain-containing protein [Spirochaetota bacterium]